MAKVPPSTSSTGIPSPWKRTGVGVWTNGTKTIKGVKGDPNKNAATGGNPNYVAARKWETSNDANIRNIDQGNNIGLGQAATGALNSGIQQFQQNPIDFSQFQKPNTDTSVFTDPSQRQKYEDQVYNNYMRTAAPEQAKQMEDFEQMALNRGWTPGSEVYNAEKNRIEREQQGQRDNIRTQAMQQSGTEWERSGNMAQTGMNQGWTNLNNSYNWANTQRTQGLQDYQTLNGMRPDNTGYYNAGLQAQQGGADRNTQLQLKKMGSGGGQAIPPLPDFPTSTSSNGPDWAGIGANILGSAASGFMQGMGKGWASGW